MVRRALRRRGQLAELRQAAMLSHATQVSAILPFSIGGSPTALQSITFPLGGNGPIGPFCVPRTVM